MPACEISGKVRLGALSGVLGMAGTGNIQGEDQKKLDVIANDILIRILKDNPSVAGLASEEKTLLSPPIRDGRYLVYSTRWTARPTLMSNISVGTIFFYFGETRRRFGNGVILQKAETKLPQVMFYYGPQTQLVLTVGHGLSVFTLDEDGNFVMTKENPRVPETTKEFAINMSNRRHWLPPVQRYIDETAGR